MSVLSRFQRWLREARFRDNLSRTCCAVATTSPTRYLQVIRDLVVRVCFTICLFISPDLDGYRAPRGINPTRPIDDDELTQNQNEHRAPKMRHMWAGFSSSRPFILRRAMGAAALPLVILLAALGCSLALGFQTCSRGLQPCRILPSARICDARRRRLGSILCSAGGQGEPSSLLPWERERLDDEPDSVFYQSPRLVYHADASQLVSKRKETL